MAGDKPMINKESQKIKKLVRAAQPSIIHFCQDDMFIEVESKDFKQVVQKLTGQAQPQQKQQQREISY